MSACAMMGRAGRDPAGRRKPRTRMGQAAGSPRTHAPTLELKTAVVIHSRAPMVHDRYMLAAGHCVAVLRRSTGVTRRSHPPRRPTSRTHTAKPLSARVNRESAACTLSPSHSGPPKPYRRPSKPLSQQASPERETAEGTPACGRGAGAGVEGGRKSVLCRGGSHARRTLRYVTDGNKKTMEMPTDEPQTPHTTSTLPPTIASHKAKPITASVRST